MASNKPLEGGQSQSQADKFKSAAKEVEANDNEAFFDGALKALAKAKPEPKEP